MKRGKARANVVKDFEMTTTQGELRRQSLAVALARIGVVESAHTTGDQGDDEFENEGYQSVPGFRLASDSAGMANMQLAGASFSAAQGRSNSVYRFEIRDAVRARCE